MHKTADDDDDDMVRMPHKRPRPSATDTSASAASSASRGHLPSHQQPPPQPPPLPPPRPPFNADVTRKILAFFQDDIKTAVLHYAQLLRTQRQARSAVEKLEQLLAENRVPKALHINVKVSLPPAVTSVEIERECQAILQDASSKLSQLVLRQRKKHVALLAAEIMEAPSTFEQHIQARMKEVHRMLTPLLPQQRLKQMQLNQVVRLVVNDYLTHANLKALDVTVKQQQRVEAERRRQRKRQDAAQAAATMGAAKTVAEQVRHAVAAEVAKLHKQLPKRQPRRNKPQRQRRNKPQTQQHQRPNASKSGHARQARRTSTRAGTRRPSSNNTLKQAHVQHQYLSHTKRAAAQPPTHRRHTRGQSIGTSMSAPRRRQGSQRHGRAATAASWR